MSNYAGHIRGGFVAFGFTLTGLAALHAVIDPAVFKNPSLIITLPSMLYGVHDAFRVYLPSLIQFLERTLRLIPIIWLLTCEWLLFTLAGAMFPDVDIKSTSQKYWYVCVTLILLMCVAKQHLVATAFVSALSLVPMFTKHRGLFHRWWFIVLFCFLTWSFVVYNFPTNKLSFSIDILFFLAGALSHLLLDMGFRRSIRFF